jgi:hypothetical protein
MHALITALAERFPAVRRLTGTAFFDATASAYLRAHPPRSPVIADLGGDFPAFLAHFPPAASLPYLPDVARLEWLRGRAYHAADADGLPPDDVARQAEGANGDPVFILHPSLHLFRSDWPAVSIWAAQAPGAPAAPRQGGPEAALIFRTDDAVPVIPVSPDVHDAVRDLARGTPLAGLAEAAPEAAGEALSLVIRNRLVTGILPNLEPHR